MLGEKDVNMPDFLTTNRTVATALLAYHAVIGEARRKRLTPLHSGRQIATILPAPPSSPTAAPVLRRSTEPPRHHWAPCRRVVLMRRR